MCRQKVEQKRKTKRQESKEERERTYSTETYKIKAKLKTAQYVKSTCHIKINNITSPAG